MTTIKLCLASCVFVALPVLCAPVAHVGGWKESSIAVNGVERGYRVYVPDALPPKAPLLLSLHGGNGNMFTIDKGPTHGWVRLSDQHHFLLLVPNATPCTDGGLGRDPRCWNDLRAPPGSQSQADDVGFIRALLDRVEGEYATDPARVYVTGNSNGGMMTYRLLMEMPQRFTAAAAFIANIPVNSAPLHPPAPAVPLMIWSGTADRLAKYDGGEIPGHRGIMRSVPETVAWWVRVNRANASGAKTEALPDLDPQDGCRVRRTLYPALAGGAPVLHYRAEGGGHTMPTQTETASEGGPIFRMLVGKICRDVDGADIAWEFMNSNARR